MMPRAGSIPVTIIAAATTLRAIQGNQIETALRAYPVLRDAAGRKIADGNFAQWVENDGLHVQTTYTGDGRKMEETAVLRQRPELSQQRWQWRESLRGQDVRTFDVDFGSGMATALKVENGEPRRWSEKLHPAAHTKAGRKRSRRSSISSPDTRSPGSASHSRSRRCASGSSKAKP